MRYALILHQPKIGVCVRAWYWRAITSLGILKNTFYAFIGEKILTTKK